MSYVVETRQAISPIVINILNDDFNPGKELASVLEETRTEFESMTEPFYYVSDTARAKWNFSDMVQAMASSAGQGIGFLKNPNLKEIIVVTDSTLIQLGVTALGQEQYGMVKACTVPTLEAALDYINSTVNVNA